MSSQLAPEHFRRACALWATGIAIVTVMDSEGNPHGMTANSFTSVSLDPPLILVCVDHRAALLPYLLPSKAIAINVLGEDQADLSSRFARKSEDRFENLDWTPGSGGAPIITGGLATFEGSITDSITAGDHQIVVAEVKQVAWHDGRPLLYFASGYEAIG